MRTRFVRTAAASALLAIGLAVPAWAQASASTPATGAASPAPPPIDPALKADIETMMRLSGADRIGKQVAQFVSGAIIQTIKQQNPAVPPEALEIARQTADEALASAFDGPDSITALTVPIYAKHFTHDEIKQIIAIYESPIGKKLIETMPTLMQEGMQVGQQWAEAHAPHIKDTINARLREKGYIK